MDRFRTMLATVGLIALLGSQVAVFAQSAPVIQQQLQDYMRSADARLVSLESLRDRIAQTDISINGRLTALETEVESSTFMLRGIAIAVATMLVKDLLMIRKQSAFVAQVVKSRERR